MIVRIVTAGSVMMGGSVCHLQQYGPRNGMEVVDSYFMVYIQIFDIRRVGQACAFCSVFIRDVIT